MTSTTPTSIGVDARMPCVVTKSAADWPSAERWCNINSSFSEISPNVSPMSQMDWGNKVPCCGIKKRVHQEAKESFLPTGCNSTLGPAKVTQRGRNRTPFPTYKRFWCHICTISIYNLLVSFYMLLSLLQIDAKRVSRQHKKTSSLVPTLQPKRLAKLVQRSTLVKHLFLPFGNFYFATFCAEISDVEIETLKPGPTQPLNLSMLQNFSCSILQNELRNICIVLVPRCQNATCCVAIALHLIPTAKVTCRAKGWRTSEHTTSTAKMILLKSTSSGLFTVTSSRCFWIFLE